MSQSSKILFVGQLPPPVHGQAMVNKILFEAEFDSIESIVLPMEFSKSIDDVGEAAIGKVWHLLVLIFKTWWITLSQRPKVFYYPPASANLVPVLRDIIYLSTTRFLFRKTIFHFHAGGLGDYLDGAGIVGKLAKWAYRKPELAIELYREEDSPGKYLSAKQVAIIANGVDVVQLEAPENDVFKLIFVGSLREDKGVFDAMRTLALLKDQGKQVHMDFVGAWGDSGFEAKARGMQSELSLDEEVSWLGVLQGKDKWNALAAADCFFFPSFYHSEKFPLVLIEALGCGLPVVSTYWRGIPQLLEGCEAGLLSEVSDVNGFAKSIDKIVNDPIVIEIMKKSAHDHYQKKYTQKIFLQRMELELLSVATEVIMRKC